MRLTAVGMPVGVLGASAVSRLVQSELHGVSRFDPATVIAVLLIIGITALASVAVPARRATRVDPVVALSAE
jgi:ABC-type antimicrobial peptide transport system permease subunit